MRLNGNRRDLLIGQELETVVGFEQFYNAGCRGNGIGCGVLNGVNSVVVVLGLDNGNSYRVTIAVHYVIGIIFFNITPGIFQLRFDFTERKSQFVFNQIFHVTAD